MIAVLYILEVGCGKIELLSGVVYYFIISQTARANCA
jgi:hypothetical protein